jgi:DNA-binding response OmpR family regulator
MVGLAESALAGEAGVYGWAGDLLSEPWTDAELLVRLFRLLAPAREYGSQAAQRSQPLLLLADDDPAWISLAEATLRTHRLTCRTATDGLGTLRLARQLLPDLLVLDLQMPGINGLEVLETIRRDPLLSTMPVALLTGCDQETEVERATELRADDYLIKPLSPTVLLNRVKRLLAAAPPRKNPAPTPVSGDWLFSAAATAAAEGA